MAIKLSARVNNCKLNIVIEFSEVEKLLGIQVDLKLNCKTQVEQVLLYLLVRIGQFLDIKCFTSFPILITVVQLGATVMVSSYKVYIIIRKELLELFY